MIGRVNFERGWRTTYYGWGKEKKKKLVARKSVSRYRWTLSRNNPANLHYKTLVVCRGAAAASKTYIQGATLERIFRSSLNKNRYPVPQGESFNYRIADRKDPFPPSYRSRYIFLALTDFNLDCFFEKSNRRKKEKKRAFERKLDNRYRISPNDSLDRSRRSGINLKKSVDVYDNLDRFGAIECHHLSAIFAGVSSIGDIEKSIFSGASVLHKSREFARVHALPEISTRLVSSRLVFVFLPPVKPICGDSIGSNLPTILCPQSRYLPPRIVERRRCVDDSAVDTTLSPGTADSNLDRSRSVSGKMWLDWWSASRDQCHRKTGKGERIGIYK